jgi:hypothetical protein
MKNIIKYVTISLLVLFTTLSCQDFLDAPAKSTMDEQTIFSTPAFAEQAIGGILNCFGEVNSYRGRFIGWYGPNTDVEIRKSLSVSNYNSISSSENLSTYFTTATNGQMDTENNFYAMWYQGIERANLAIRGMRAYADFSNPELRQIFGEILTLRAMVYYDLLRTFSNVPARFEPLTEETTNLPKSDRDVILKQILADLEEAADMCGWPNENGKTQSAERVNKAFVKGLRARLALMAAGYSQHLGVNGTIGKLSLSTDPDLTPAKMYQIAKDECLDVINSGTCRLLDYEEFWKTFCFESHKAGMEELYSIPFSDGRGRVLFDLGVPHNNDKYVEGQADKGGSILIMPTLWYDYDKEDVRRNVTCCPWRWEGTEAGGGGKKVISSNASTWYIGKYRYEWLPQSRWSNASTNDDGLNYMVMRYSDILLMAAEAVNELDGPATAAPYLKEVRDRAYPNNSEKVSALMANASSSKDAFFKHIVRERALEFAGEMLRKQDIIRWGLLDELMLDAKSKLNAWSEGKNYTDWYGVTRPYSTLPWDAEKFVYNVYSTTAPDGEEILLQGLEYGDPKTNPSDWGSKDWNLSGRENGGFPNGRLSDWLYGRTPSTQPYWPIWFNFINSSEGVLNNDDYNAPQ